MDLEDVNENRSSPARIQSSSTSETNLDRKTEIGNEVLTSVESDDVSEVINQCSPTKSVPSPKTVNTENIKLRSPKSSLGSPHGKTVAVETTGIDINLTALSYATLEDQIVQQVLKEPSPEELGSPTESNKPAEIENVSESTQSDSQLSPTLSSATGQGHNISGNENEIPHSSKLPPESTFSFIKTNETETSQTHCSEYFKIEKFRDTIKLCLENTSGKAESVPEVTKPTFPGSGSQNHPPMSPGYSLGSFVASGEGVALVADQFSTCPPKNVVAESPSCSSENVVQSSTSPIGSVAQNPTKNVAQSLTEKVLQSPTGSVESVGQSPTEDNVVMKAKLFQTPRTPEENVVLSATSHTDYVSLQTPASTNEDVVQSPSTTEVVVQSVTEEVVQSATEDVVQSTVTSPKSTTSDVVVQSPTSHDEDLLETSGSVGDISEPKSIISITSTEESIETLLVSPVSSVSVITISDSLDTAESSRSSFVYSPPFQGSSEEVQEKKKIRYSRWDELTSSTYLSQTDMGRPDQDPLIRAEIQRITEAADDGPSSEEMFEWNQSSPRSTYNDKEIRDLLEGLCEAPCPTGDSPKSLNCACGPICYSPTSPIPGLMNCEGTARESRAGEGTSQRSTPTLSILDKEYSIDEEVLATPLEPIKHEYGGDGDSSKGNTLIGTTSGENTPPSILRRQSSDNDASDGSSRSTPNRVTFPDEGNLCQYQEPGDDEIWELDDDDEMKED